MISISEAMNADIATKLDEFGANMLILPKMEDLNLTYGGMTVSGLAVNMNELNDKDIAKILTIKNKDNISIIAPKLINVTTVNDKKVMVVGVDFVNEFSLKKWWSIVGKKPQQKDEILIGKNVKQSLNIGLNQTIWINGDIFIVGGILEETGSQDDDLVFMDLEHAQKLFQKPESISLIEVSALCYDCPIEEIVAQTSEKLPSAKVTAIRQTIQSKMKAISHFQDFSIGISILILLIGALIVFTTMMASVNERIREIGIFRAIGFRKSHVLQIILSEAFLISIVAGLFGYFLGLLLSVNIAFIMDIDSLSFQIDWQLFGFALFLSLGTGLTAGLYPAIKASKLDPVDALRTI
jgi:putative ABC transport system permease protein